jgi:hypothetical protein
MARKKKIVENKTEILNEKESFSEILLKDNTIQKKNEETLEKMQKPAVKVYEEQEKKKKVSAQSVLDKYTHNEDEYQAHLKKLRETDFVNTVELKLRNVKIPGFKTIWASTDPKATPSILTLKKRGYYVVQDEELIPTGSTSVEGAGFHILMACPDDLAKKRELGLRNIADEQFERVLKKKIEHKGAKDSFLYEKNTLDEDFSF